MGTSKLQRVYVPVTSSFDSKGYMQPQSILWKDGRVFKIEAVKDCRPVYILQRMAGECYTVIIRGQEKQLFFERANPRFSVLFGRWYVETGPANA